jgi:hypothetical protein
VKGKRWGQGWERKRKRRESSEVAAGSAQHGSDRRLAVAGPREGEEGVGRVGPNGQERSGSGRLGRMAGGPILEKGNGVRWGCHGNRAKMRFGLPAKNRNCFANF